MNQFEGDWTIIHPDEVMTGRVVTAQYMPLRPDLEKQVKEQGKMKTGLSREEQIHGQLIYSQQEMFMSLTVMVKLPMAH